MIREIARLLVLVYFKIFHRAEFINLRRNVPQTGALILYANHISNADPLLLGCAIRRMVYFMAKQELFKNRLISRLMTELGVFPVKRGAGDVSAIKNALAKLKLGGILSMFPEGTRRKPGKPAEVKPGLAMLAIRAKCPVLPAVVVGKPRFLNKMKVIYGKPIDLSEYYGKDLANEDYIQISEMLMKETEKLMEG